MNKSRRKMKIWQKVLLVLGIIAGLVLLAAATLIAVLTVREYKPADEETVQIDYPESDSDMIAAGETFKLFSWNIGFAAQGEDTDCFLDGGKAVIPTDKEGVQSNLSGIVQIISENDPDIIFLQEVDTDSKRSHYIDEYESIRNSFYAYSGSYTLNYSTLYVPYPFPETLGKVNAGLAVFTKMQPSSATRIALPCSFNWPVSTVNLKRCLLVERIPVSNSDKELVLINLHLEAYDDGEGKAAQTKQLCELLQAEYDKGNYVIAAGDFNQTFSDCDISAYSTIEGTWQAPVIDTADFGDSFSLLMDPSVPSCRSLDKAYKDADHDPSAFQYYVIDGFIVSDNISIEAMETLDEAFRYSDHNPIVMEFTLQ